MNLDRIKNGEDPEVVAEAIVHGEWPNYAECSDEDPSLFFEKNKRLNNLAKAMCAECIVEEECLDNAVSNNEKWAVLGGMTPPERRKVRRERIKVVRN